MGLIVQVDFLLSLFSQKSVTYICSLLNLENQPKETSIFTEEELAFFYGVLRNNREFLELQCGCTVLKYGDTAGKLRVYRDGKLEIDCECFATCQQGIHFNAKFLLHVHFFRLIILNPCMIQDHIFSKFISC